MPLATFQRVRQHTKIHISNTAVIKILPTPTQIHPIGITLTHIPHLVIDLNYPATLNPLSHYRQIQIRASNPYIRRMHTLPYQNIQPPITRHHLKPELEPSNIINRKLIHDIDEFQLTIINSKIYPRNPIEIRLSSVLNLNQRLKLHRRFRMPHFTNLHTRHSQNPLPLLSRHRRNNPQ